MTRCSTPDVLIGLGGSGGSIVYRLMSQDWLLNEVLKTDEYDAPEPDQLKATVIDTAKGEEWQEDRATEVREKIHRAIDRYSHQYKAGHLTFDGPQFLPEGLLHQDPIQEPCQAEGLNSWWLSENILDQTVVDGFEHGIMRRRSVAKALYHIANYTNSVISPSVTENDEVAIVTALGGGTGSGIALDFAKDIDSHRTHLYAVLPHRQSTLHEKANAHAALSELEYAQLTGESPFSTITLIPHLTNIDSQFFEMAAVRTILAHQNKIQGGQGIQDLLPGGPQGPPDYAPFTVAVPHTVEHPISLQNEAKEILAEFLARKHEELQCEADLYNAVETYLQESFPATAGVALEDPIPEIEQDDEVTEDVLTLQNRVEQNLRETLLEDEVFRLAGFSSEVQEIRIRIDETLEQIHEQLDQPESTDDVELAYQFLQTAPEAIADTLEYMHYIEHENELLSDLVDVLQLELENIARRRELLISVPQISSDQTDLTTDEAILIRTALFEGVLDTENDWIEVAVPSIGERIAALDDKRRHLEQARKELEIVHEDVATEVRDRVKEWRLKTSEAAQVLTAINEHRQEVLAALDSLEDEIRDAIRCIEAAETPEEVEAVRLDLGWFREINNLLDKIGLSTVELLEIEDAFNGHVRGAKVAYLEYRSGILGRLTGPDYGEEYLDHGAALDHTGWFQIEPEFVDDSVEFSCTFSSNRLPDQTIIEEYRNEALTRIVDSLNNLFFEDGVLQFERTLEDSTDITVPSEDDFSRVEDALRTALDKSKTEQVDTLFSDIIPTDVADVNEIIDISNPTDEPILYLFKLYLSPIRDHYDRINEQLERVSDTLDRIDKVRGLAGEHGTAFARGYEGLFKIDPENKFGNYTTENPYVERRDPNSEVWINNPTDIGETQILETEEHHIAHDFEAVIADIFAGGARVPIKTLTPHGAGANIYDNFGFCPVYMSRAIENSGADLHGQMNTIDNRVQDEIINQGMNIGQQNFYVAESYDSGGPDEISMVTFITGIFLDNIAPVSETEGYYDAYQEQKNAIEHQRAHHSIGLGGAWEKWEMLGEWATKLMDESASNENHGAYVFRNAVRDVYNGEFIDMVIKANQAVDEDPKRIFLDMLKLNTYESTVSFD